MNFTDGASLRGLLNQLQGTCTVVDDCVRALSSGASVVEMAPRPLPREEVLNVYRTRLRVHENEPEVHGLDRFVRAIESSSFDELSGFIVKAPAKLFIVATNVPVST